jgi:hypothetical protein
MTESKKFSVLNYNEEFDGLSLSQFYKVCKYFNSNKHYKQIKTFIDLIDQKKLGEIKKNIRISFDAENYILTFRDKRFDLRFKKIKKMYNIYSYYGSINIYFDNIDYYTIILHCVEVHYDLIIDKFDAKLKLDNGLVKLFGEVYVDSKFIYTKNKTYFINSLGYFTRRDLSPTTPELVLKERKELVKNVLDLTTDIKTDDIVDIINKYAYEN